MVSASVRTRARATQNLAACHSEINALREERDRVLAGRQLADETGDRDGLVPHHHVTRTRHHDVPHVS